VAVPISFTAWLLKKAAVPDASHTGSQIKLLQEHVRKLTVLKTSLHIISSMTEDNVRNVQHLNSQIHTLILQVVTRFHIKKLERHATGPVSLTSAGKDIVSSVTNIGISILILLLKGVSARTSTVIQTGIAKNKTMVEL